LLEDTELERFVFSGGFDDNVDLGECFERICGANVGERRLFVISADFFFLDQAIEAG
jgi:hypothetical protein